MSDTFRNVQIVKVFRKWDACKYYSSIQVFEHVWVWYVTVVLEAIPPQILRASCYGKLSNKVG